MLWGHPMLRIHVKAKGEESQYVSLVILESSKNILCSRIHLQPSLRYNSSAPHLPLPSNPAFRRELLKAKMHPEKFSRYLTSQEWRTISTYSLLCTQNQLSPSLVWHLLNSSCFQARRAGCTVLH